MSRQGGYTVKDVPPQEFIVALAQHFKKAQKIELPEWHDVVKTGPSRELAPQNPDWYYIRAASVARKIYLQGGRGLGAFAQIYGASQRRGMSRPHHVKASRGLVRHILQQLEQLDYISKKDNATGRYITAAGRKELDTIANQVQKAAKPTVYTEIVRGVGA